MLVATLLALCAFGVSLLTLFTGFGLGTLLLPAFALFFSVEVAVAATAIVHGANNLFKVSLLGRKARRDVVLRFGVPAVGAAFFGAMLLAALSGHEPLITWSVVGIEKAVTPIKLVMGGLILGFAAFELVPALRALRAPARWLPVGGILSGFFGGLSGHQGALRAAFLVPLGLSPTQFAATQAVIGLLVDAARLLVYGWSLTVLRGSARAAIPWTLVAVATLSAFAGALLGTRLLPRMTLRRVHRLVGWLLVVVGVALGVGLA